MLLVFIPFWLLVGAWLALRLIWSKPGRARGAGRAERRRRGAAAKGELVAQVGPRAYHCLSGGPPPDR